MNNMTYQEIIEELKKSNRDLEDFAYENISFIPGLTWEEIEQIGGEGEGDHWHSVKYFPEHNIYIKITGYYQSYNGTEFYGGYDECCSQVTPQQRTITVYE